MYFLNILSVTICLINKQLKDAQKKFYHLVLYFCSNTTYNLYCKGRLIINVSERQIHQFFARMYEIYGKNDFYNHFHPRTFKPSII